MSLVLRFILDKAVLNYLLLIIVPFFGTFSSSAERHEENDHSSATISINGVRFFQTEEVTVDEFKLGDDLEFDIKGTINIDGQPAMFTITIPSLSEASYTREGIGSLATVSIDLGDMYLSSSGPFVPGIEDLGDHLIEITQVNEKTISGNFVANLQDGMTTETLQIAGEFILNNNLSASR